VRCPSARFFCDPNPSGAGIKSARCRNCSMPFVGPPAVGLCGHCLRRGSGPRRCYTRVKRLCSVSSSTAARAPPARREAGAAGRMGRGRVARRIRRALRTKRSPDGERRERRWPLTAAAAISSAAASGDCGAAKRGAASIRYIRSAWRRGPSRQVRRAPRAAAGREGGTGAVERPPSRPRSRPAAPPEDSLVLARVPRAETSAVFAAERVATMASGARVIAIERLPVPYRRLRLTIRAPSRHSSSSPSRCRPGSRARSSAPRPAAGRRRAPATASIRALPASPGGRSRRRADGFPRNVGSVALVVADVLPVLGLGKDLRPALEAPRGSRR